MKKYSGMLVLGIVALILAGVYFVVVRKDTSANEAQLYRFSSDEALREISISNGFGNFVFQKVADKWEIVAPAHYRMNQEKAQIMQSFLLNLPINRTLDQEIDEYGFTDPRATIAFVTDSGEKRSFQVGKPTMSNAQTYLKDLATGKILVADLGSVSQFDGSLAAYRDKEIFTIDKESIAEITYYKNGEKLITVQKYSPQDWRLTFPFEAPARYIELSEWVIAMRKWSIAGYPEQAELDSGAMGLDDPTHVLEVKDANGDKQRLEFGNSADGTIFVRTGSDQDIVKQFSVDVNFDLLNADRLLFFAPLRTTIQEVQKVDITYNDRKVTIEVDNSVNPPVITSDGNEIDYADFVTFFVKYISLSADGHDPLGKAGEPVVLLTTTYKDGSTKTLRLLHRDANSFFMEDGSEIAFYVNSEKLDQLVYHLEAALATKH